MNILELFNGIDKNDYQVKEISVDNVINSVNIVIKVYMLDNFMSIEKIISDNIKSLVMNNVELSNVNIKYIFPD